MLAFGVPMTESPSSIVNADRDPVCGMPVGGTALTAEYQGHSLRFCSEFCRNEFLRRPSTFSTIVGGMLRADVQPRTAAYFSMEIVLRPDLPTYSGGLGVLAGDTLRSFADLRVPVVAVTLVHRAGYFRQGLSSAGQSEVSASWWPETVLPPVTQRVEVEIERRRVVVQAWRYDVVGSSGYPVPVFLLDTDVEENTEEDRRITDSLYGGDARYRLMQEIVLGVGGVRFLRGLGYAHIRKIHLNEGHAALAGLELLREEARGTDRWNFESVRERCVFTTHTPVPAGHDKFDLDLVERVLGDFVPKPVLTMLGGSDRLDMTWLALNLSTFVNGVARRHKEISEQMFPRYQIRQVTNGVHSVTWTCESFRALFDAQIPEWRQDPAMLRHALGLRPEDVWNAHHAAKQRMVATIQERTGRRLHPNALTVGCARRATTYKRNDLVLADLDRLRKIAAEWPIQFVFASKAHPRDEEGKQIIRRILETAQNAADVVPIVFLADYDVELAGVLVSRCDLWLNTPLPPLEASGTSGMKAAHNGVPSLSTRDGWWIEGHVEGVTGWSFGDATSDIPTDAAWGHDAASLYDKFENVIAPIFYHERARWISIMQHSIALNASFFNAHRMVQQYVANAYI